MRADVEAKTWAVLDRIGVAKTATVEIDEPELLASPQSEPEKQAEEKAEKKTEEKAEKPAEEKTEKKPAKKTTKKAKAEDVADADA